MYGVTYPKKPTTIYPKIRESIDLPEQITTLVDRSEQLHSYRPERPEKPISEGAAIAHGEDPSEAVRAWEQYEQELAEFRKADRARSQALSSLVGLDIPRAEFAHAREIIEGPLRHRVHEIMSQAREHSAELRRFWPGLDGPKAERANDWKLPSGFSMDMILKSGTPVEVEAYQATIPLQAEFATLASYWLQLLQRFQAPQAGQDSAREYARYLPNALGGIAVWQNSEAVEAAWVRGAAYRHVVAGDSNTVRDAPAPFHVLTLGTVDERAGFRLASADELRNYREAVLTRQHDEHKQKQRSRINFMSNKWGA